LVFLLRTVAVNVLGLPGFGPLSTTTPLIFSGVLLTLGALVFTVLSRTAAKPMSAFNLVALIALLLSFVPVGLRIASPASLPAFMNGFGAAAGNQALGNRQGQRANSASGQAAGGAADNAGNADAQSASGASAGTGQRGNRQRSAGGGLNGIIVSGTLALMHLAAYGASVGVFSRLAPRKRKKS
jgi:hypothetical protein